MTENTTPLFSLVYTTVRPNLIPQVYQLWNSRSVHHDIEWCIALDDGDTASIAAAEALPKLVVDPVTQKSTTVKVAINKGPRNCNAGWNAATEISTGKIIIAVADDFVPPQKWDESLLALEPKSWPDEDRVIHINDGYVRDLCTLAILTRTRYDKFGYLWYPKYQSMFNDTEFTETAYRDGVVIEAMHLLFEHMHPDCGKRDRDDTDRAHASQERWNTGEMLFKFRKARGFPLDDGPKAPKYDPEADEKQPASKNDRFVAYMQVTRDDVCLLEVCKRLAEEGVVDFFFAQPNKYWSGEPIEDVYTDEVTKIAQQLQQLGLNVYQKTFDVERYRFGGDDRLTVETRVRNDSLVWIRSLGFHHILIVDGDELWMRGTLDMIKPYVEQGHNAISTYMIPVIGLPGYPIEFAQDLAVVYIGGNLNFKSCRTPTMRQTIINFPRIYHFTGTRRTMEETIVKHRRSGHYDDPDYDFEGWIKNILPNVKPGLKNAHMYKKYQIWPNVRDWRPDEIQHIPQSLYPYLGMSNVLAK